MAPTNNNPVADDFADFESRMNQDFDASVDQYGTALPMNHRPMDAQKQVALLDMMQAKPQVRKHFVDKYGETDVQRMEAAVMAKKIGTARPPDVV